MLLGPYYSSDQSLARKVPCNVLSKMLWMLSNLLRLNAPDQYTYKKMALNNHANIVLIGGGTGSFTILSGIKQYTTNVTALVNMADDGGSTGVLRDELGVLPPGDVRQCLVALSDTPYLRDLFNYRFEEGSLKGHSFGNLFLSAVEKMTSSFDSAVELAGEVLNITGKVIPVTNQDVRLVLEKPNGEIIRGEYKIGHLDFKGDQRPVMRLEPNAKLHPHAEKAIMAADIVLIAPGSLYGSLAPALIIDGMREALKKTKAKKVYICNLVTKPGQTDGFKVHDFAEEVERFIGEPLLDIVLYNTDEPPKSVMDKYTHDNEFIVEFDLEVLANKHYKAIGLPIISHQPSVFSPHDRIASTRSLIRHDTDKVAREVMKVYFS